jgi:hypothetical protein
VEGLRTGRVGPAPPHHRKGLIGDPVGKAKSVVLTDEGLERSAVLLETSFARKASAG